MMYKVYKTDIPKNSSYLTYISGIDYSDAYKVRLKKLDLSIEEIYINIFLHVPNWIMWLMKIRNMMFSLFGLKTDTTLNERKVLKVGEKFGIFKIYSIQKDEIIVGEDDRHLDFRVSILKQNKELIISTFVHYNNLFGKAYMTLIYPIPILTTI